jgi:3-isopropylmalate dehydrogenase
VKHALDAGRRTGDLVQGGTTTVTCSEMGDAILKELEKLA